MKNNNLDGNQEFEKLLKDKMNELSSSVDCFDRISAKAFPEKNPDFSESGFTVCDLENVTGKSKKPMFLKWTAVAVACAVCAVIIPKTSLLENLTASFGKSSKKIYSKVIAEINSETSQHSYKVYDMPVDDYIKYDKLVTPLYPCPFSDCGKDNINVRIFVRTYDGIPTNQIYAVEYAGDYTESNFIAVADTKAKFTDEELENLDEIYYTPDDTEVSLAVMTNFTPAFTAESFMTDRNENNVSLASFEYESIFKSDDEKIYYYPSQIIYYGNSTDEPPETYYYDINNVPDTDGTWKNTVCFDGFSSMPEESKSLFVRTPLFERETSLSDTTAYGYVTAESYTDYEKKEDEGNQINFYSLALQSYGEETISTMAVPYDNQIRRTIKMYFSKSGLMFSSDSDSAIVLSEENSDTKVVVSFYNEGCHDLLSEEEQAELFEMLEEREHKKIQTEHEEATVPEIDPEDATNIVKHYDYRF
ncbi:MAG: hypothetical protein NC177_10775 [Ruminococcus flavefaciens]|nr:hypothetical protein [Ruminococcus flavefaciens]